MILSEILLPTSILIGVLVTSIVGVIAFLMKREIVRVDNKIKLFESNIDNLLAILKTHGEQIAINTERDKAEYRLIEREMGQLKKDLDKEIINVNNMMNTQWKNVQSTLERILNKLDEHDKYFKT